MSFSVRRRALKALRYAVGLSTLGLLLGATQCQEAEPEGPTPPHGDGQWLHWAGDIKSHHHAADEWVLNKDNVDQLELKWQYDAGGSVTNYPSVVGDIVYTVDWGPELGGALTIPTNPGGKIHAINRWTGKKVWSKSIYSYTGNSSNNMSRTTPTVAGDLLIFGDGINMVTAMMSDLFINLFQVNLIPVDVPGGANIYAIDRHTGDLVWKTNIGNQYWDTVTQSPTVHDGKIFVGVSSLESVFAKNANAPCCEFRGSFSALDLETGEIIWKTYMVPDNQGSLDQFSGAAVWGSSPTIDTKRNQVYIPTGNNYMVPQDYLDCARESFGVDEEMLLCQQLFDRDDNMFDAIVALDLDTGDVNWSRKVMAYDVWTLACDMWIIPLLPGSKANCTDPRGDDFDFAQAPMLGTITNEQGLEEDRLFVGQKSGVFWALQPDDGEVIWATSVGPGGFIGGMEYGAAFDGERIYTQISNYEHNEFELVAGPRAGETVNGGIWAALDPVNGDILWQTPVPASEYPLGNVCNDEWTAEWGLYICMHPASGVNRGPGYFSWAVGPLTAANGLVFAGAADLKGNMYAFDGATGEILWNFESGASVMSAPSIVDGRLYWGSGAKYGVEGRNLYSFGLPDELEASLWEQKQANP